MSNASDQTKWRYIRKTDPSENIPIEASSLPLPTGAATSAKQDIMITALQLIDDLRAALDSVGTDELRVGGKDGDKLFAFESIVEESVSNLNLAAGNNTLTGAAVPAGKIWKITTVSMFYVGAVPTKIYTYVTGFSAEFYFHYQASPVDSEIYNWTGELYLQAGDYLEADIIGATAGDDFYLKYAGVQMNAP